MLTQWPLARTLGRRQILSGSILVLTVNGGPFSRPR